MPENYSCTWMALQVHFLWKHEGAKAITNYCIDYIGNYAVVYSYSSRVVLVTSYTIYMWHTTEGIFDQKQSKNFTSYENVSHRYDLTKNSLLFQGVSHSNNKDTANLNRPQHQQFYVLITLIEDLLSILTIGRYHQCWDTNLKHLKDIKTLIKVELYWPSVMKIIKSQLSQW